MGKHSGLADEQYGRRGGRMASDTTALTALTLETLTLQWSNAALTDCNAMACYDRIIPAITSLRSHKMGLPKNICKLYTKTLDQMEYKMIMAYRESEESNKNTENNRIYG
eukprot:11180945-Ditylum_brightwellii.AAC.1